MLGVILSTDKTPFFNRKWINQIVRLFAPEGDLGIHESDDQDGEGARDNGQAGQDEHDPLPTANLSNDIQEWIMFLLVYFRHLFDK